MKPALALTLISGVAAAQPAPPATPAPVNVESTLSPSKAADDPNAKPKGPKRGDFDAGGQVRLPNGPDEEGKYATFNWVAVDLRAKYYLLDTVTIGANIPVALIHPDTVGMMGPEPQMIGGMSATLDARLPKMPKMPFMKYDAEIGLLATVAYMREGALLLSEKDFPLFAGDFKPGFVGGLTTKVKLSNLVDFSLVPTWVYQSGTTASHQAVQLPTSLILKLGDVVKVAADLGIYTGDDYTFGGAGGGRIATGASLDVKLGKILAHAGIGFASLLTGPLYPTVGDSVYIDLNVKFAK
ncbi:MAG: hypothetical protein KF773_16260 [Deltaproteobacteria bacterium]|nr:hypothetical protein [Deltaproteobacteria bacterium]MCW5801795.1 hypothetical protein [Deltaproteobacteria bacterium]